MKTVSFLFILLYSTTVFAQPNVVNPTHVVFEHPDFNQNDADGNPLVTSYYAEILLNASIITSFTIQRSSVGPVQDQPPGTIGFAIPSGLPILPTNIYRLRLAAENDAGRGNFDLSINGFYTLGTPSNPTNLRLIIQLSN